MSEGLWHFSSREIDGKLCGCHITDDDGEIIAILPRLRTTTKAHWQAWRRAADICLAHNAEVWEKEVRELLHGVRERIDTSDIPEAGEEFFRNAVLR